MCGLFAVINKKNEKVDELKFKKSLAIMKPRGPDWTFFKKIHSNLYFGQNVLSMTGNNKKQDSIFRSKSKRYLIIFNGEIYNYKELQKISRLKENSQVTDTEILIDLIDKFGLKKTIKLLDGMFVFLIYDYLTNSIYFYRDPQGEKSLFFYEDNNHIIFSSDILPIKNYIGELELEPSILETYFYTRHFIQLKKTIYKFLTLIQKGELEQIDINTFKKKSIIKIKITNLVNEKSYFYNRKKSLNYHINYLENLLTDSLKEMVPKSRNFSTIVSGGIDSSLVSILLKKISEPSSYISLNHIDNDTITNDLNIFQNYFDKKIQVNHVSPEDYIYYLNKIYQFYITPIHTHSFVGQYMIANLAKKNKSKAIFGGEAVDELFGGYSIYNKDVTDNLKNYSYYSKISNISIFKNNDFKFEFIRDNHNNWLESLSAYAFIKDKKERNKQAMMLNDFSYQVSNVGLRGGDLMAMANSVEQRSVFIRKNIIKYALNLPIEFKINNETKNKNMKSKFLIKKIFEKYFGEHLILKKQGFSGFPSSLNNYLGSKKNYIIRDILGFKNYDKLIKSIDKNLQWKINNTELFLRYFYGN